MDLDAYVAEHAGQWHRLEYLARRRRLSAEETDELVALYQRTVTQLSVIQSRSPDPALVARLSRLVLTARSAVTGGRTRSWAAVGRFFTDTFPLAVLRAWPWWSAVSVLSTITALSLMAYIAGHPDVQHRFLSDSEIDSLVSNDFAGYYSEYRAQNFAAQVWTNNAFLAAQCLASGVLILPVLYLLAMNLFNLGLVGGVMINNGRSDVLFGMLAPHGLLELTAVFVAAGVGLRIGWSWIAPGPHRTRSAALAATARSGMVVALGLVPVLGVAGLLEGFVTPSTLPPFVKITLGATAWLGFLGYVVAAGSAAAARGRSDDLDEEFGEAAVPVR